MIQALTLFAVFCYDLVTDVTRIRKQAKVHHGISAILRTIGLCVGGYLEYKNVYLGAASVVALTAAYWIGFDMVLNVAMGWAIMYSGKTSFIDRIIGRVSDEWEMVIKVGVLLLTVVGFFLVKKMIKDSEENPNHKLKGP